MATYLAGIELPNVTSDPNLPDAGFNRFYVSQNKLYRKLPNGTSEALSFEDMFLSNGERNPVFTYSSDLLTRIDYDSGNYKVFTYDVNQNLTQLDFTKGSTTFRKVFNLDVNSNIVSISYSIV